MMTTMMTANIDEIRFQQRTIRQAAPVNRPIWLGLSSLMLSMLNHWLVEVRGCLRQLEEIGAIAKHCMESTEARGKRL